MIALPVHPVAPIYIGADVSLPTIDLGCPHFKLPPKIANTPAGYALFQKAVAKSSQPVHVICEATGPYHKAFVASLHQAGIPVTVVKSSSPRDFARCTGRQAKTDPIDALLLADYGAALKPKPTPAPEAHTVRLDDLVTRRAQLVADRACERTRLQQVSCVETIASMKAHLRHLDGQVDKFDALIAGFVKATPVLGDKVRILVTVSGVGAQTASALLACLPELGTVSGERIASLAGLAPFNRDSGAFRGVRCIRGGRREARQALFMAALSAMTHNVILSQLYHRLRKAGKHHKVALTALMRRLLVHLNLLLEKHALNKA